jgi:predicted transcriptional regulator of viral defense system
MVCSKYDNMSYCKHDRPSLKYDILSYNEHMPTARFRELTEMAADRQGLVRTEDAAEIGYAAGALDTMARRGQLERVGHGVYRVPFVGVGALSAYMAAALWPRGVQGVLTHDTALDLWDVCDINPSKIHITVPRRHRPQRAIPDGYVIHREDLDPTDITAIEGVPVVILEAAIRQCAESHVGPDLLEQAVRHGRERGLLRRRQAQQLTEDLHLERVGRPRA